MCFYYDIKASATICFTMNVLLDEMMLLIIIF